MNKDKSINQIPIIQFLLKHKWRIVIPLMFALLYWAIPRYTAEPIAVQQYIFFKSDVLTNEELKKEFFDNKERVHSSEYLKNLIIKYDLFQLERKKKVAESALINKLRNSINLDYMDYPSSNSATVWILFKKENSKNILPLSKQIMSEFEKNPNIHTEKFISNPYDANPWRNYVFFGAIMQGLFMLVIPLILLWEIPNLFYSQKTKSMVFDPIKADWQDEIREAKLKGSFLELFYIHIRYGIAYLLAVIQKSPLGDFFEFASKIAK